MTVVRSREDHRAMTTSNEIPSYFWWRRLHSLFGLGLVLFLFFHLLTNSQAALLIGDDGRGFIHSVNAIHDLPYVPIVELLLIGMPLLVHAIWGIKYIFSGEMNSYGNDGKTPYLPEYGRNHAYTWQRITSWILLVGIVLHVAHMRFYEAPQMAQEGAERYYIVKVGQDNGIYTLSDRLNVALYDQAALQTLKAGLLKPGADTTAVQKQETEQSHHYYQILDSYTLDKESLIAVSKNFGTAELLMLRNTFKSPWMILLYTILVFAACFHAFNGLWTFMITWGVTLTVRSQRLMLYASTFLMLLVTFFGLAAIYATYWINLRH